MSVVAPLLQSAPRVHVTRRALDIGSIYRTWAQHYNDCAFCQRDDWFSPLEGEPYFCPSGQGLFRNWVSAAHLTPISTRANG